MKFLGNIIWLIFGGLLLSMCYLVSGVALMLTIIGIPFGLQVIKLAIVALWPFGAKITIEEKSTGCLSLFMNILWLLIGGFWICLGHVAFGLLLCITIVGIPFGKQHFKLATLALSPFGKRIE